MEIKLANSGSWGLQK